MASVVINREVGKIMYLVASIHLCEYYRHLANGKCPTSFGVKGGRYQSEGFVICNQGAYADNLTDVADRLLILSMVFY